MIILLSQQIDKLDLRLAWLLDMTLWREHAEVLENYIISCTKEPVTESQYREIERKARSTMVPVAELADVLVKDYGEWTEHQLEEPGGYVVKAECWEELHRQRERQLAALVSGGVLIGKGKGRSLRIQRASFDAWFGESSPLQPEWGCGYEVLPDEQEECVAYLQRERKAARDSSVSPL